MITLEKVQALMVSPESDLLEKTISTANKDKLCQAVCAFSNDYPDNQAPGYYLIGVNDDGSLGGIETSDKLELELIDRVKSGNITPLPAVTLKSFSFKEGDVIVIEVQPSIIPPVRYKGEIWIRTGPRKDKANITQERLLAEKRKSNDLTFDTLPCQGASIKNDLALDLFTLRYLKEAVSEEVLEENNRSIEQKLAALRFYSLVYNLPTNAGVILFGINPLYYFPGAYIQFVRFDKEDLASEVLEEVKVDGSLVDMLKSIDSLTNIHFPSKPVPVPGSALREENKYWIPRDAVRELILNAVIHRDYQSNAPIRIFKFQDRIEISNPGGLYGTVNKNNFPNATDYRNPTIAEAVKVLGYVNRFGRGIRSVKTLLENNGNAPAVFENQDPSFFMVTVYGKS